MEYQSESIDRNEVYIKLIVKNMFVNEASWPKLAKSNVFVVH